MAHFCACRVGNALGANDPHAARLAVIASIALAPCLWIFTAVLLVEPHVQRLIVHIFTDGTDEVLLSHVYQLLWLSAAMLLFDGWQMTLQGFLQASTGHMSTRHVLAW